ncbi:SAVMC3_10250 family protein [Streptomyces sp. TS71-3]|uniref:DUF7019 family protein n=1 Tax=Streptomyces sp. TS71-3 TaxID=2733862 RepID=UPI001B0B96AD|nr:SAVMC3_10250 family protein [Streptomyces sp. TS71-3]GHJ36471.1 hypothetical protein Sm713_20800 [Streptomyces sp. TS71-3]
MRYYTYISDAKVNLLFEQIPQKMLSRLAADFAIDLKVISLAVHSAPPEATGISRLQLVERHIEQEHEVGSVHEPAPWFRGELGLRSGIHRDGLMLLTGIEQDTLIALIGSAHHLVGGREAQAATERISHPHSQLPALFGLLERDDTEPEHSRTLIRRSVSRRGQESIEEAVALRQVVRFAEGFRGPRQASEFLARQLMHGTTTDPAGRELNVLIGTPLYVALSDG